MSVYEHLAELRRRIIYSALAFAAGAVLVYFFSNQVRDFLLRPGEILLGPGGGRLVWKSLPEAFLLQLRIAAYGGLVLASPVIMYNLLAFVLPGLEARERAYVRRVMPAGLLLFLAGVSFAYFVFLPFALRFFTSFDTDRIHILMSAGDLITFTLNFVLPFGVVFELPLVVYFLAGLGIVSPAFLVRNRKFAVLAIFITAAVLTPPDIFSQFAMAVPMLGLYELSIWVSRVAVRGRRRESR